MNENVKEVSEGSLKSTNGEERMAEDRGSCWLEKGEEGKVNRSRECFTSLDCRPDKENSDLLKLLATG
jgi:hypothetical protein